MLLLLRLWWRRYANGDGGAMMNAPVPCLIGS
jgi:hypothetical protein